MILTAFLSVLTTFCVTDTIGELCLMFRVVFCSNTLRSGIIASVITMERYLARFGNNPSIRGAVVSTFNGAALCTASFV